MKIKSNELANQIQSLTAVPRPAIPSGRRSCSGHKVAEGLCTPPSQRSPDGIGLGSREVTGHPGRLSANHIPENWWTKQGTRQFATEQSRADGGKTRPVHLTLGLWTPGEKQCQWKGGKGARAQETGSV